MKNFLKNCPLLAGILLGTALLTIVALCGFHNIYATQEYDPLKQPLLAVVFTGINDEVYPWDFFDEEKKAEILARKQKIDELKEGSQEETQEPGEAAGESEEAQNIETQNTETQNAETETGAQQDQEGQMSDASGNSKGPEGNTDVSGNSLQEAGEETVSGNDLKAPLERLKPLRESTYDEYINHISADIYGDAGVQRAAAYDFKKVDESYFDDALFIGDSRTVGLYDYTDLPEHADFLCETSLTIYKVMGENFKGKGTVEEVLAAKNYGKIYIMMGINELGRGTTEDFMQKYTEVVDTLHEWDPDARIIIQGIMKVSKKKDTEDKVFNNSNITGRNHAIATLADNYHIFYIDMNEAVCDEEGNLNAEYTHDQIHLLGMYNDLWKDFLMTKGISG